MDYRTALKACRPNGASAQVIAAVPEFIAALEAVQTWITTKPNEDDERGYLGPANYARAEAIRAVKEALAIVGAPSDALFQPPVA